MTDQCNIPTEQVNFDAIMASIEVRLNTSNGVAICVTPRETFNCAEFSTKADMPQPMLIAPWIQFEPRNLSDLRARVATEIARRSVDYPRVLKAVDDEHKRCQGWMDAYEDKNTVLMKAFDMWRAERQKYGLPEDFSDVKEWPPEMMNGWRSKGNAT